jgi:leucyl-tRNA synthetase
MARTRRDDEAEGDMSESGPGQATGGGAGGRGAPAEGQPPFRYCARLAGEIESRWQDRWEADGTFNSANPAGPLAAGFGQMAGRRKFYILDMFPYPSGAGLHVGHPLGYIATDVYARYLRMTGHHVMHTFGFDAFGLPAEQYAIDTGQHPRVTTRRNIDTMRSQLRRLGLGHDRRRPVATTDASYYKWTQWIFLKIFNSWADERTGRARPIEALVAELESGQRAAPGGRPWAELDEVGRRQVIDGYRLAYRSEELVNWCPGLGTVLANEEITADGRSDVGNYPVYRRPLRQWMLRITAFADRLIDDLDLVDWPGSIKQMQRNWIGASDGAIIRLPSASHPGPSIEVFTTRPDTLSGATYVVLAPEHPLVGRLVPDAWPEGTPRAWRYQTGGTGAAPWAPCDAVTAYQQMASRLSDRQRTAEAHGKTGVFTGAYLINPATGAPVPVFLADYVLMGYGTGAIMAVPAHDQRDLDFAHKFGLDVRAVLEPPASWLAAQGVTAADPPGGWQTAFTGAGRYVSAPGPRLTGLAGPDAVAAAISWLQETGAGRGCRSYRLRDWLFSRQRYWGEPFPIVYDQHGLPVALPDEALPVRLPEMTDFRPEPQDDDAGDPVPPLARATDWATVELDLGDGRTRCRRELNTMPQWAGSCWYYLRYLDPANDQAFVDPDVERYWMVPPDATQDGEGGVDLYMGGVEHAVLHLLYARFWHKVLYDLGYVSTKEPFRRLYNQGYILADAFTDDRGMYVPAAGVTESADGSLSYQGQPVTRRAGKMGKSLRNSVSPDDIYQRYGADSLRLYEMAMGPLDTDRPWRTSDIIGVHRFLQRLWRALIDEETGLARISDRPPDDVTLHRLHATIMVVRKDFEALRFNTAIARLMELTSHAAAIAKGAPLPRQLAEPLVLMLAPLAPHIAEELWARLGHRDSLAYAPFPVADEALAAERTVSLPVQVNGKTRFTLDVPAAAGREEIGRLLMAHPDFAPRTAGLTVERLVIVPGRIANIVAR